MSVATSSAQPRLAWLDALRGIGALAVVAEHMTPWFVPSLRPHWFHLGVFGIFVFFLVSGYIIPASLERHGDVRTFWLSRVFRLYPLYLTVALTVVGLSWWVPVREAVVRDGSAVAGHVTMLLDVVDVAGVADTMWTLSYEMVFYLLVTALFLMGLHQRSGLLSVLLAGGALVVSVLVGGAVLVGGWVAYVSCAVFLAGLACLITGRFRRTAAAVLGVMALTLLVLGSRVPWLGVAIVAMMFAGTAIHRWERGEGRLWPVAVTLGVVCCVPFCAIMANWWWVQPQVWITTMALTVATFATAMALRGRRVPRVLVWLGLISYSLYLVHHPLLRYFTHVSGDLRPEPLPYQLAMTALALALVVGLSVLTYRFVERPMQELGRRIARKWSSPAEPGRSRDASAASAGR
jgi:peptidoglycan/LPS O-acetylase OafA/YrhL